MKEPDSTILSWILAAYPGAKVTRTADGKWRAEIPDDRGARVVIRRELADVQTRLSELGGR